MKGPRRLRSRGIGVIVCSLTCAIRFEREIGGDILLHDFALTNARADRRCRDCATVLAPHDRLDRCRMCRLTVSIENRFRREAKRSAQFRAIQDAHRVYVRRMGAAPLEEIIE